MKATDVSYSMLMRFEDKCEWIASNYVKIELINWLKRTRSIYKDSYTVQNEKDSG